VRVGEGGHEIKCGIKAKVRSEKRESVTKMRLTPILLPKPCKLSTCVDGDCSFVQGAPAVRVDYAGKGSVL
jgi:hypothetical protein